MLLRNRFAIRMAPIFLLLRLSAIIRAASPTEVFDSEGYLSIQFSPDSRFLVKGSEGYVALWDIDRQQTERFALQNAAYVRAITFSGQGQVMALGIIGLGKENPVELYTWPGKRLLVRYGTMSVTICQFSQDGSLLMLKPLGKDIILYDVAAGKIPRKTRIVTGSDSATDAILSPDGTKVCYFSFRKHNYISIWDITKSEVRKTLVPAGGRSRDATATGVGRRLAPTNYTYQVLFTPDGRYLVTVSIANEPHLTRISLWETANWQLVRSITYYSFAGGNPIAISPDSSLLAVPDFMVADPMHENGKPSKAGPIALIDIESGNLKRWCKCGSFSSVIRFVFSPDGKRLAAWMADSYLRIWNMEEVLRDSGDVTGKVPSTKHRSE